MMSRVFSLATVLLAATQAVAQTYTSCNPLNSTACPSDVALGSYHTWNWTASAAADTKVWNTTAGTINWEADGAEFTVSTFKHLIHLRP